MDIKVINNDGEIEEFNSSKIRQKIIEETGLDKKEVDTGVLNKELDIESMKEAIKYFEGEHDFTSFVSSEDIREDKVRTIYKTDIKKKKDTLEISFIGNGFMKYQVRNMVGLLISIGEHKKDINDVVKVLNNRNRSQKFKTAPSCGLYLNKVWY